MKRRNLIFVMLLVFSGLFVIQSCKKESPVAFTEEEAFTIPTLVAPVTTGGFLNVTGTTVDLQWASTNAANDPQNWAVYFGPGDDPALIQSGYTQETITVNVTPGTKYNWKVVGTDSHGIHSRSPIWSFEVIDAAAPLDMKMNWTTDISTVISGLSLAPDAAVNLRLLILKADTVTTAVPIINTNGFEEFAGFSTLPDGTYFIATDIASTVNLGTLNAPFDISINLAFNQRGVYNLTLPFANVMTNEFNCALYRTILAKVTKTGNVFTADKSVRYITPPVLKWKGTDATYPSQVTTTASCASATMTGLGFEWFFDWWGEVIVTGGTCTYSVSGSTITIPLQPYCTTTFNGAAQPAYSIQGTGTIDNSGAYPIYTIHYDFIQNGASIATISEGYGWPTPYFEAIITTNPAKGGGKMLMHIDKPKR